MARMLVVVGIILIVLGLAWPLIVKLPLGRLPGDIVVRRENFSFYFPLASCLLVSIVLSLLLWLFRR